MNFFSFGWRLGWLSTGGSTALTLSCAILLSGCRPGKEHAEHVELVPSSEPLKAASTFELRFEESMVSGDQTGDARANSPLLITPPLPGTFTWLSARSGVFTPAGPLAMDTRYEFSLRPRLTRVDGTESTARLFRVLTTPSLGLNAWWPRTSSTNAHSSPEIQLVFNVEVHAKDAQPQAFFADDSGRRIAVEVRQGTERERPSIYQFSEFGTDVCLGTWREEFEEETPADHPGQAGNSSEPDALRKVPNLLIMRPAQPLPVGNGWKLVLERGMPAVEKRLRLPQRFELAIGDVTPFTVVSATVEHVLNAPPSVTITFSKPVPSSLTNEWPRWILSSPLPADPLVEVAGDSLTFRAKLKSRTVWKLSVLPGFPAEERSFALRDTNTIELAIPPIQPRLYFPAFSRSQQAIGQRVFPLLAVNVPKVRLRAKLLEGETAIHALAGYEGGYFRRWRDRWPSEEPEQPYRAINYDLVPGWTIFDQELEGSQELDQARMIELSWDRLLAGRSNGVVFLEAERMRTGNEADPPPGTQALMQLTDLGLLWKRTGAETTVYVFSQSTGQPVPGASARLYDKDNVVLSEAATDAQGMARLQYATNAAFVAARLGADFHALEIQSHPLSVWSFHLPYTWYGQQEDKRRVLLFSDRELYRPGETLHLKALVRDWTDHGLEVPNSLTGRLECLDSRGQAFFTTNVLFNTAGSWSVSAVIPAGPLGYYRANLLLAQQQESWPFQVEEFQPSAFEIKLTTRPRYAAGEPLEMPLSAQYFFGKSLSRAQVKWTVQAADHAFEPEAFKAFRFQRAIWEARLGRGSSGFTMNGQGTLFAGSNFVFAPDVPVNPLAPQPREVSVLAEVTDLNQQTLTRRAEFVVDSSEFYLGLREPPAVILAGRPLPVEAVAVAADGNPWPQTVSARLKLQHIDWQSTALQGAGHSVRYRNEAALTTLEERELAIAPVSSSARPGDEVRGQAVHNLVVTNAGDYLLEISGSDPAGRPVVSSIQFSVSAPAEVGWDYQNEAHLALKPDRTQYTPGQTAQILVETPFSATALVTIEREKVLRSFLARLEGNAPTVRVPLEPTDVPNVFVCVTLVRGSQECPRPVRQPDYRYGYCQLSIEDPQSRLQVNVTPAATNCLPGQPVEVAVTINDARAQPVAGAEVTLFAVDEGILSITESGVPDPHCFFYQARRLSVSSYLSLPDLITEDPNLLEFGNKGYLGGGGGKDALRKNFLACAFWRASALTGAEGKVTVRFAAPDSMTRYRIVAVAHAGASQFGTGQSAFQVTKPLVIEPALPKFATIGDQLLARAVVHNQTSRAGEALVTIELDDKASSTAPGTTLARKLAVPAGGSMAIEFPLVMRETGNSQWIWRARFADPAAGDFADAVQSRIEVGHLAPLLREISYARITQSRENLLAGANPQILAGKGAVILTVANTRLSELAHTAAHLLHYPYGCAEQTGSSLLPWIVLDKPLLHCDDREAHRAVEAGVDRLFSMQTQSGGLSYWPGGNEPMLWASAYGGLVLGLARRHSVPVPEGDFKRLMDFLSEQLRKLDDSDFADHALALYALAVGNRPEPAYAERLFAARNKLGAEDRALLALAILEGGDEGTRAGKESSGGRKAKAELGLPAPLSASPAAAMVAELLKMARTDRAGEGRFGSADRTLAIRLLAWIRFQPANEIVDSLVSDLMRNQKDACWSTTQENAWALLALTEYGRRIEGMPQPARGHILWNGQSMPFDIKDGPGLVTLNLPLTNTPAGALALVNETGAPLYTTLTLEARAAVAHQPRQDHGFSLQRGYQRLDDENHPQDLKGLRVGDRVLVTLRLNVRHEARFVAVDDALPCTLEAINPGFKTQSARGAPEPGTREDYWLSDFHELRKDRFLSFANHVFPGNYLLRYVARVRAAGTVGVPSAKVEEMYHPDRYGLTETTVLSSQALP